MKNKKQLIVDSVVLKNIDDKSFSRVLSVYGKPKGIKDKQNEINNAEEQIKIAETLIDSISELPVDDLIFCFHVDDKTFLAAAKKPKEVLLDTEALAETMKGISSWQVIYMLELALKLNYAKPGTCYKTSKDDLIVQISNMLDKHSEELIQLQDELSEMSKPTPIEDWQIMFAFDHINICFTGQVAKDLFESFEKIPKDYRFHIYGENNEWFSGKTVLYADSFEIIDASDINYTKG